MWGDTGYENEARPEMKHHGIDYENSIRIAPDRAFV
jgi:hypothetical protein